MRYIPISQDERAEMLRTLGLTAVEELFQTIPEPLRRQEPLDLPGPYSELELIKALERLGSKNATTTGYLVFLGAGAYHHFRPAHIDTLVSRSEFLTSYTPYQPEVTQGTLQAIFEYQTMICQLTGMDVANASLYDGSTALAEAVLMAERITGRRRVLIAASVHPEYQEVVRCYTRTLGMELETIPYHSDSGRLDWGSVAADESLAAVVVQSPNFFGTLEDFHGASEVAHQFKALMIGLVVEPLSLALVRPPGDQGVDIVAGEGQSFGVPVSFGGPYLGLFATRQEFVRQMPGRLAGQAYDQQGRRGFVLAMSTREQHIRREKATSNICTNQGLVMLMATIYLATMGPRGLREVARQNVQKSGYALHQISRLEGYKARFAGPRFNEFAIQTRRPVAETVAALRESNIIGGFELGRFYPELGDCLLVCVTEMISREEIDRLVDRLDEI